MADSDDTTGGGAASYSVLVKQPYKPTGIFGVHDLPLTWGWSHPRERGYAVVHDASLIHKLLEHLDTLLKGFEVPEGDSDTGQALTRWTASCGVLTGRMARVQALIPAVVSVVHDILTRHPRCLALQEADTLTKCVASTTLTSGYWGGYGALVRWDTRGGAEYRYRLTIKSVADSGGHVLVDVVPLAYDFADHHLDKVVEICKAGKPVRWAQGDPVDATDRLVRVLAYYCYKDGVTWLMLSSQPKTVLLKFTSATKVEDSYLTCSDVLQGEKTHLALSLLVSLCFVELRKEGRPLLSSGLSVCRAPDVSKGTPPGPETPKDDDNESISLSDLQSRDVILGFAALGEKQVDEQYCLKRQSKPDLDPLVVPLPSCSVNDGPPSNESEKKEASALIVATEQVGAEIYNPVYLASYGRHRLAVKVCRGGVPQYGELLRNEYGTYCAIRRAGLEGRSAPRCFGLFVHAERTVLITAFSGNRLEGYSFESVEAKARFAIYAAARELGEAGIQLKDFSPRNVVCDDNGVYRVFDYHGAVFDKSKALQFVDEYLAALKLEKAQITPLPATDDKDLAVEYEAKEH